LSIQKNIIGISLVELMVSVALSIFLSAAIVDVTLTASRVNRQVQLTSEMVENGRYLGQLLNTELSLAGFYGWLKSPPIISGTVPDRCSEITTAGLNKALSFPLDGIDDSPKRQQMF